MAKYTRRKKKRMAIRKAIERQLKEQGSQQPVDSEGKTLAQQLGQPTPFQDRPGYQGPTA